jgi:nucleoside-diphosphate-sugar epimerase/2-polyprenyl-3-methyl-5-hydroxy-6-metoxy-1,4-benzoquinol methylase
MRFLHYSQLNSIYTFILSSNFNIILFNYINNIMKLLVIGGCGYIGTQFVDVTRNLYPNIEIIIVDSNNYSEGVTKRSDVHYINAKFQDLPKSFYSEFTDIILLAGQGSVSNSENVLSVIDNNVRNFAWLLETITLEQKLIYASSSSVYGRTDDKEVDEEFSKTSGYEPYNYYDWSKQTIDQLAKLSGKQYYSLRFGTVNGFSRNLRNDVMINSMSFNAKKNGKIFVSNNNVNRPILGINDLCKAILNIVNNGHKELSGVYNINSFNATVGDIAYAVSAILKVPCENTNTNTIINFKLQTKSYDFKIHSTKFIIAFDFEFEDTLNSIIYDLVNKWEYVENFQNRLDDNFIPYKMTNLCRVCNTKTKSLLNLGDHPLANSYTKYHETLDYNPLHLNAEEKYPLHLHYCPNCFHTQLNCVVRPEKIFKNYLYVSGTSKTLQSFFHKFAGDCLFLHSEKIDNDKLTEIKILDIACNDGSQLDAFRNFINNLDTSHIKVTTVGVDPAENIYKNISSQKSEHDIYCEFFNQSTVDKLKEKYGEFDIILAQNVFAHINYPGDFLKYTKQLMNDNSSLYIQTSQKNMILQKQFDTVYHEHLSFFNTNSMNLLCQQNKLFLSNVYENEIHGTSYIFEINKTQSSYSNIEEIVQKEFDEGLYSEQTYKYYNLMCLQYKNNFSNKITEYKLQNKQVIAFGSTAKSMTVFNFCNITNEHIDFMIDDNYLKQNLFTPGSNIIVLPISSLKDITHDCVILITAWNFYSEIKDKIKRTLVELNVKFPITLLNIDSLEEEIININ